MSLIVDIQRDFGGFVLDAAFEAENGITCLLGSSGCGKSLTLKWELQSHWPGQNPVLGVLRVPCLGILWTPGSMPSPPW